MPRNEIFALFGSIGSRRGENNEKKVYEAIQKLVNENCCPAWLTGYTSASKPRTHDLTVGVLGNFALRFF